MEKREKDPFEELQSVRTPHSPQSSSWQRAMDCDAAATLRLLERVFERHAAERAVRAAKRRAEVAQLVALIPTAVPAPTDGDNKRNLSFNYSRRAVQPTAEGGLPIEVEGRPEGVELRATIPLGSRVDVEFSFDGRFTLDVRAFLHKPKETSEIEANSSAFRPAVAVAADRPLERARRLPSIADEPLSVPLPKRVYHANELPLDNDDWSSGNEKVDLTTRDYASEWADKTSSRTKKPADFRGFEAAGAPADERNTRRDVASLPVCSDRSAVFSTARSPQ
ncbi:hypothetical protein M3Y99_01381200 [Aphelenchoides fujianensis]|nr:hypothetical protein M3Y99_01381200 [Aphelenchoides fujianensis]